MAAEHTVYFRYLAVAGVGVTIDLTAVGVFGALYIINKGSDPVYFRLDGVIPAASFGNNRKELQQYEVVNLENIEYTQVTLISSGGPSDVEVAAAQRVGAGGII